MRNKWFVSLLMVVVMMCACWTGALAEDEERETFTSGDYEYALLDDGTVEIAGYKGSADLLAIPAELDGKTVTAIGDSAFFFCFSLTSVSIPDSVEQIGANPFRTCSALKTISVSPEHPYFATIDGVLFRKADKTLISYPAGINSSTYTIPQGITAIGDSVFSFCSSLTSVSIPDSVEQIGANPFGNCSALKTISVSPEHPYFATIDDVLLRKADKTLISYPKGIKSSTYTIPQGIASIGDRAFSWCFSLTSVSIPDSVTSIGDSAFSFCPNLTLTVPRNSYAAEYAKTNNISYTYPDANDWLNN